MPKLKQLYLLPLKSYQFFSKLTPPSCRYYPTCSEYAKWQFECTPAPQAFLATAKRILSCNPLFEGGIDYPSITFRPTIEPSLYSPKPFLGKIPIIYWFVPISTNPNNQNYYIIKDFNAIRRTT